MRITSSLLVLSLLLSGCGGGGDAKEDGLNSLQLGKYQDAADQLDSALASRTAADADYAEVAIAKCQALAHVDGGKAKDEFLALASAHTDKIGARDYSMVVSDLFSAGNLLDAIDILDAGLKRFPDDKKLAANKDKVVAQANKAGDPAALEKLKGLGYL